MWLELLHVTRFPQWSQIILSFSWFRKWPCICFGVTWSGPGAFLSCGLGDLVASLKHIQCPPPLETTGGHLRSHVQDRQHGLLGEEAPYFVEGMPIQGCFMKYLVFMFKFSHCPKVFETDKQLHVAGCTLGNDPTVDQRVASGLWPCGQYQAYCLGAHSASVKGAAESTLFTSHYPLNYASKWWPLAPCKRAFCKLEFHQCCVPKNDLGGFTWLSEPHPQILVLSVRQA